jgi:hypothetical protein
MKPVMIPFFMFYVILCFMFSPISERTHSQSLLHLHVLFRLSHFPHSCLLESWPKIVKLRRQDFVLPLIKQYIVSSFYSNPVYDSFFDSSDEEEDEDDDILVLFVAVVAAVIGARNYPQGSSIRETKQKGLNDADSSLSDVSTHSSDSTMYSQATCSSKCGLIAV